MKLNIASKEYTIVEKIDILLNSLIYIQENLDPSLGFKYNCKSGVCGTCSLRVNGVERLACSCKIKDNDIVEPLKSVPQIKDLIVDGANIAQKISLVDTSLYDTDDNEITQESIELIDVESNCILCNACYSSCPVYEYNKEFIGPFALTRAYKYYMDSKDKEDTINNNKKLEVLQSNGIWDCTLCSNCSMVCPQAIDIKGDIQKLQNISMQNGFENPYMQNQSNDFDTSFDFGFNPNFS